MRNLTRIAAAAALSVAVVFGMGAAYAYAHTKPSPSGCTATFTSTNTTVTADPHGDCSAGWTLTSWSVPYAHAPTKQQTMVDRVSSPDTTVTLAACETQVDFRPNATEGNATGGNKHPHASAHDFGHMCRTTTTTSTTVAPTTTTTVLKHQSPPKAPAVTSTVAAPAVVAAASAAPGAVAASSATPAAVAAPSTPAEATPSLSTRAPTTPRALAYTGAPVGGLILTALSVLAAGAGLLLLSRPRQQS